MSFRLRKLVAAIALVAATTVPVLLTSSCAACSGPVKTRKVTSTGYELTIHSNTKTGKDATFCTVAGSKDKLTDCTAGTTYPKCKK